jgi:hypothetical protein
MNSIELYRITVFCVLSLVFLPSLIGFFVDARFVQSVKAGKVDDFCWNYSLLTRAKPKKINCGGHIVDVTKFIMFVVCGNSMKPFGVIDRQRIFVNTLDDEMKNHIATHPVLVFLIVNASKIQSQYKLRKFITYIEKGQEQNWEGVYESNRDLILGLDKDSFVKAMSEKQKKMNLSQERHVLSITFNEHTQSYECSLHPVSSLYGVVKYAA